MKNGLRLREKKKKFCNNVTLFRGNSKFIPDGKLDARTKIKLTLARMPYKKVKKKSGWETTCIIRHKPR